MSVVFFLLLFGDTAWVYLLIIYLNENNFCRSLRAHQNHLNELMYGPRPHFLIFTVQHLYTMPFMSMYSRSFIFFF